MKTGRVVSLFLHPSAPVSATLLVVGGIQSRLQQQYTSTIVRIMRGTAKEIVTTTASSIIAASRRFLFVSLCESLTLFSLKPKMPTSYDKKNGKKSDSEICLLPLNCSYLSVSSLSDLKYSKCILAAMVKLQLYWQSSSQDGGGLSPIKIEQGGIFTMHNPNFFAPPVTAGQCRA